MSLATQRRMGVEGAKNRDLLVDAAERVMLAEGYAAVTARRVAAEAGLKTQLVYYYFQTMDDLIRTLVQKNSARRLSLLEEVIASDYPLHRHWEQISDPATARLSAELLALAHHRESIRNEIVVAARAYRDRQVEALDAILAARGVDRKKYPAAALMAIVSGLARAIGQDRALGWDDGYLEASNIIEHALVFLGEAKPDSKE